MIEATSSWYSKSIFSLRMNLSSTRGALISGAARDDVISRHALSEFVYQLQHHQYLFNCLLCVGISPVSGGMAQNKPGRNHCFDGIYGLEETERQ